MKMMQGAFAFPCSNKSRTRLAPTPTNISTKSDPDIEKNGRAASPATARARSVLPVPGGPTRSAPLGNRPPSFVNLAGSLRNSMISCSSTFASSQPATSLNVTFGVSPVSSLAFDLPNENAFCPPDCIWRKMKIQKPMSRMYGSRLMMSPAMEGRASWASICTLFSRRRSSSRSEFATGSLVVNFLTSLPSIITRCLNSPAIVVPAVMVTFARLSA